MSSWFIYLLYFAIAMLPIMNIYASWLVYSSGLTEKIRKQYQCFFIWLVPYIGAIVTIVIHRETEFTFKQKRRIGNASEITENQAIVYVATSELEHSGNSQINQ